MLNVIECKRVWKSLFFYTYLENTHSSRQFTILKLGERIALSRRIGKQADIYGFPMPRLYALHHLGLISFHGCHTKINKTQIDVIGP